MFIFRNSLIFNGFLVVPGIFLLFFFKVPLGKEIHEVFLTNYSVLFPVGLFMLVFYLAAYIICRDIDSNTSKRFSDKTYTTGNSLVLFLIVLQTCASFLHFVHIGFSNIPIVHLIQGNSQIANELRLSIISPGGITKIPYFYVLIDLFIKFVPIYIFSVCRNRTLFILSFLITAFYLVYDLQKGPFLIYLICIYSIRFGFRVNFKNILLFLMMFITFIVIYSSSKNIYDSQLLFYKVINRLFILQHQSVYLTIELLESNWLNAFHHIPILDKMVELPVRYDEAVMHALDYDMTRNINMNGVFFAEAYSISPIIFFISPVVVIFYYFLLRYIFKMYSSVDFEATKVIFVIMLFYYFPISQSFNQMFVSYNMILFWLSSFVLLLFIRGLTNYFRTYNRQICLG
ncbi:hypothetical protein BCT64_18335 [Vibrio breoganii]|nr:hypothetical protein BCT64_18335 [Vibrio breoganii]PMN70147.1 hypothetical protein BCT28_18040 [Vibrio breoganii]